MESSILSQFESIIPYLSNYLKPYDIINLSYVSKKLYYITTDIRWRLKNIYSDSMTLMFINAVNRSYINEAKMIFYQYHEKIDNDYVITYCKKTTIDALLIISEILSPYDYLAKGDPNSYHNLIYILYIVIQRDDTHCLDCILQYYKPHIGCDGEILLGLILTSIVYDRFDMFDVMIQYYNKNDIDTYLDLCYLNPDCNKNKLLKRMRRDPKILNYNEVLDIGHQLITKLNIDPLQHNLIL